MYYARLVHEILKKIGSTQCTILSIEKMNSNLAGKDVLIRIYCINIALDIFKSLFYVHKYTIE